jgi:hypothetical protein
MATSARNSPPNIPASVTAYNIFLRYGESGAKAAIGSYLQHDGLATELEQQSSVHGLEPAMPVQKPKKH